MALPVHCERCNGTIWPQDDPEGHKRKLCTDTKRCDKEYKILRLGGLDGERDDYPEEEDYDTDGRV